MLVYISDNKERNEKQIPMVLLVLEGGKGTLETVKEAIVKGVPVVVIGGSGRAADLIDDATKNQNRDRYRFVYHFHSPH